MSPVVFHVFGVLLFLSFHAVVDLPKLSVKLKQGGLALGLTCPVQVYFVCILVLELPCYRRVRLKVESLPICHELPVSRYVRRSLKLTLFLALAALLRNVAFRLEPCDRPFICPGIPSLPPYPLPPNQLI